MATGGRKKNMRGFLFLLKQKWTWNFIYLEGFGFEKKWSYNKVHC